MALHRGNRGPRAHERRLYSSIAMRKVISHRRVLVVGWGFLGGAIGRHLFDQGVDVVGLTRSEGVPTRSARTRGIDITIGDATDHALVEELLQGVDHVLFAAGGLPPPAAAVRPRDDLIGRLSPLLSVLDCARRGSVAGITYLSSGGPSTATLSGYRFAKPTRCGRYRHTECPA